MNLLPWPKYISLGTGNFQLNVRTVISLDSQCSRQDYDSAVLLQQALSRVTILKPAIVYSKEPGQTNRIRLAKTEAAQDAYTLAVHAGGVDITAGGSAGLFYGMQTLRQVIASAGLSIPELQIEDCPNFEHRGFLHDITRGKVPKLDTLKDIADRASYYKLNELQLNIEHTFAFQKMSEVWRDADPITADEILELDEYCRRRYIELVPAVATFGHLYEALSTKSYRHLCELEIDDSTPYTWPDRQLHHTLDVSNPQSLEFVRGMLDELLPLFSSEKVNICCDETFDLGEGKNRELALKEGKGRLYLDFLLKIVRHALSLGKTVMFWDDILLEHPDYLREIPKDVICLTWQYAAEVREEKIQRIQSTGLRQYVCPGVSAWNRLAADMDTATANILGSAAYAKKHAAIGLLNTDWGDYGHINLLSASLPGMILGASAAWNVDAVPAHAEMDKSVSILEYGDHSGTVVMLQRELGGLCRMSWGELTAWYCEKFLNRSFEYPNTNGLAAITGEDILSCRSRAGEIERELTQLSCFLPDSRRQDLEELAAAARGTALLNGLLLVIKKFEFRQDITDEVVNPSHLAEEIEYWLADYSRLWRNRNKESELHRIRTVLFTVCDYLRSVG